MAQRRDHLPGRIKKYLLQQSEFGHFTTPTVDLLASYVESFLHTVANGLVEQAATTETQILTVLELYEYYKYFNIWIVFIIPEYSYDIYVNLSKQLVEARKDLHFLQRKLASVKVSDSTHCKKRKAPLKTKKKTAKKVVSKRAQKRASTKPATTNSQLQKSIEEDENYDESE